MENVNNSPMLPTREQVEKWRAKYHPDFVVISSGAVKVYPGIFSAAHGCPILTVYAARPIASQFSLMVGYLHKVFGNS